MREGRPLKQEEMRATATMDRGWPWWWLCALFLLMLPALLRGGLVLDDRELIFENPATSGALGLVETFTRDYFHHLGDAGQWRPVASLSLRLDRWLFADWVTGYHLMNGLLHLLVVACAAGVLRLSGLDSRAARWGLLVFALHPVLTDSVIWISGRTSMLSALFPLAGAWWSLRCLREDRSPCWCLLPGCVGLALGLLAKEDALIFAVLLPCLALTVSRPAGRMAGVATGATLLLWCLGRNLALGSPLPSASSPALGDEALAGRLLVGGKAWIEAGRLALLPLDYPPQYRREFLLGRSNLLGTAGATAWLGWALGCVPVALLLVRRRVTWVAVSSCLVVLAFLPVTQVLPLGEVFAPRFLYLPLLFAVPAMGTMLARVVPARHERSLAALLGILLAGGLYQRAGVYQNTGTWRAEMLAHQPDDVPSWNALGLWFEEQGQVPEALETWRKAIDLDPNYSRTWSNLGRVQMAQEDWQAAEESMREARRCGPHNAVVRVNLGTLCSRQGRHEEAVQFYSEATRLAPGIGPAWRGLGSALAKLGASDEAQVALERALKLDPGDRAAQTLLRRLDTSPPEPREEP